MDRREWLESQRDESGYTSVDPAPPEVSGDLVRLRGQLLDAGRPMFERMRALFALRNEGGPAAVDAIAAAFVDGSALLRHELAYVLGQMQDSHAVPVLTRVLSDEQEHVMVRHEAAEALGAIGGPAGRPVLERFLEALDPEVSESCEVALDLLEWMAGEDLEYADP